MTRKEFKESGMLEMFVMGLCEEEDLPAIHQLLDSDPTLKAEVEGLQSSFRKYLAAHAMTPPPYLKSKVVDSITKSEQEQSAASKGNVSSSKAKGIPVWMVAISGLAALVFLFLYFQSAMEVQDLKQDLAACSDNRNDLESQNRQYALENSFFEDPNTLQVAIRGTNLAPDALAVAYWNEEKEEALFQFVGVPKAPSGKTYQLWADVEGEMIDMGVLESGSGELVSVPFIPNAESLNITLEDEGGADHPNVEQIFLNGGIG